MSVETYQEDAVNCVIRPGANRSIPMSDFIDENGFSTTSLDRYLDHASRGSMSRSETKEKNLSLPMVPFSRRRRSASSSVISVGFVWSEMVALIRTLSIR